MFRLQHDERCALCSGKPSGTVRIYSVLHPGSKSRVIFCDEDCRRKWTAQQGEYRGLMLSEELTRKNAEPLVVMGHTCFACSEPSSCMYEIKAQSGQTWLRAFCTDACARAFETKHGQRVLVDERATEELEYRARIALEVRCVEFAMHGGVE